MPEWEAQVDRDTLALKSSSGSIEVKAEDRFDALAAVVAVESSGYGLSVWACSTDIILAAFELASVSIIKPGVDCDPLVEVEAGPCGRAKRIAETIAVVVLTFEADHCIGLCAVVPTFELLHVSQ